jgi:hypothetical protein
VAQPTAPQPVQNIELIVGGQRLMLSVPGTEQQAIAARAAAAASANGDATPRPQTFASNVQTADLSLVARRARVKADGCDFAITYRFPWIDDPADVRRKAVYDDIIARAKALPNCYVWTTNPRLMLPAIGVIRDFRQAFVNLALSAEIALGQHGHRDSGEDLRPEAYQLLAEAQSAIRAALERESLNEDADQQAAFFWLREKTFAERIHVPRHMKIDDPADIENGADLFARLEAMHSRIAARRLSDVHRRTLLNKARYHARRLLDDKGEDTAADWRTFADAVSSIVERGAAPSDVEIREMVLPLIELLPEGLALPQSFDRVLEATDRYIASREGETHEIPRGRAASPEVVEAATLLEGSTVVLIGGECRLQSQAALERELHLGELRWVTAAHHQSHYLFEPAIARPETAVVLLAVRWSSHSFENVKTLCDRYRKPFVRLPGGYNPNQVAAQILAQVGDTLRAQRVGVWPA